MKKYLLTPGPTMVPESVLSSFAKPVIHHRTPEFKVLFENVQKDLAYLFQTKNPVLILSSSGTGAMEATVSNLFSPGDTVLTLNAGKFGARWTKIAQTYGLNVIEIKKTPGEAVSESEVADALEKNPKTQAVLWQASETSTGVELPSEKLCAKIKSINSNCLTIVDAITALGVIPLPMDAWKIDVLITGSQKALMLPPGLAALSLSPLAWKKAEDSKCPKFYFNLKKELEAQKGGQTAWTPAVSLIQGLGEALAMVRKETLENVFKRHFLCAEATRAAVQALGLTLFAKGTPSQAVTAVHVPKEITDGKLIPKHMRDNLGVSIAGGQDELEGKIFRLTHLGYIDRFDIVIGISALELTLQKLGFKSFQLGTGVGAALKVFQKHGENTQ